MLRILEALVAHQPIKLDALAETVDFNKSTTYRLLRVLQEEGYAERVGGQGYRVGPAFNALTALTAPRSLDYASSYPLLLALADTTEETVTIHRRAGDLSILVFGVQSDRHQLRQVPRVGEACPLIRGCSALAILASMQPSAAESVIDRAVLDDDGRDRLRARLIDVAARGYATSDGENHPGTYGIAVPLGMPLEMSVTVAGPANRWTDERAHTFLGKLRHCADQLTRHFSAQ